LNIEAQTNAPSSPRVPPRPSIAEAKAGLLAWAEQTDERSKATKSNAAIVVGGLLAAAGGVLLVRMLTSRPSPNTPVTPAPVGKRLVGLLLAAKAAKWLVPLALSAVRASIPPK
jgi:hypothetical protein